MQATPCTIATSIVPLKPSQNSCELAAAVVLFPRSRPSPASRANTVATMRATSVNYNSSISVFPAEACETLGGDACLADMYPEVKLQRVDEQGRDNQTATVASELVDREYLEYSDSKTVFLAEACDDLGGEFCSIEYQKGVY
ncbi:Light-regulated protein 1, chloroplastic [Linum perenne]